MARRVKKLLKGTNEVLVTLAPHGETLTSSAQLFSVFCVRPLDALSVPRWALSLDALFVLLYDSPNYCNKCFSSGGGPEVVVIVY